MSAEPALMLVTDRRSLAGRSVVDLCAEAVQAGVDLIQVREKDLPDRDLLALAAAVVTSTRGTSTRILVNGRPDVALLAGAHGVQLPEEGLPVAEAKRAFPELIVGASRHSLEGARRAQDEGADLVVLGPIFATPGKEGRALGAEVLAQACRRLAVPVYAIGGIDASSAARATAAGALGLAGIRVFVAGPVGEAVAALKGRAST